MSSGSQLVQPPFSSRNTYRALLRIVFRQFLVIPRVEIPQRNCGQTVPVVTTSQEKMYSHSQRELPVFVPVASGLVTGCNYREPGSVLFARSLQVCRHMNKNPLIFLFSRLNNPNSLSFSSEKGSLLHPSFLHIHWIHSCVSMSLVHICPQISWWLLPGL